LRLMKPWPKKDRISLGLKQNLTWAGSDLSN
jgi:hypothetical protein